MSESWLRSEHKSNGWPARATRLLVLVLALAAVMAAQDVSDVEPSTDDSFITSRIELVPVDGAILEWKGQQYPGQIEIKARAGGLVMISELDPESYLVGIREVPAE